MVRKWDIVFLSAVVVGATLWAYERPSPVAAQPVPAGLVAWWAGVDHGRDRAGHHDALLMHNVTSASSGFVFDGKDSYVNVPDSEDLRLTHSLTVEARFRAESASSFWSAILFRGDTRGALDPYFLHLRMQGNVCHAIFHVESQTAAAEVTTPVPLHTVIHMAGTLDDATGALRLYLNGRLVDEKQTPVRPFKDLDPHFPGGIAIGNHAGRPAAGFNFSFNGVINEVKVYNRALTPSEVAADVQRYP